MAKRFSTRTPDLGSVIGRNKVDSIDRMAAGMSQTRGVELLNAKKIAIANYEAVYLRSSIATMQQEKVRKAMREALMNTCYMTTIMWEKFDQIIFDPQTRIEDAFRHLWDFPCLAYNLEGRNRRTIAALINWLKKTHGIGSDSRKWNDVEAIKVAKGIQIGNVIAFKAKNVPEGEIGYNLGIVFQLPEPYSEFKEFDSTFHVDSMQPVDKNAGTNHTGCGSGTWWRNGPAKLEEGAEPINEDTIDVVKIEPEQVLWSEMEWAGLARPIIELDGPARLNFHRGARVWKLKSVVNTLIIQTRLQVKNYNIHNSKMGKSTKGGICLRKK